jgi:hypothetical protein
VGVGMENPNVQLLVYRENIGLSTISLEKYKGVKIKAVQKVENANYLFIDLEIKSKGELTFIFLK